MADFKLGFSLNTSELEKGKKALHEVADAAGNLVTAEGRRKAAHDTADAALNKTITASKQAEASAQRYIQSLRMEEQATKAFEGAQKSLNAALDQGKLSAQQHANYIKQVGAAYWSASGGSETRRATSGVSSLAVRAWAALWRVSPAWQPASERHWALWASVSQL